MAIFKAPPPPLPAKNKSTNRREMCSLLSPPAYPSIVLFEVFEPPAQCTGFSLIIILIGSFYRACIVRCFPLSNGSDFDFLPCVLIYTNSCINVCTHTHTHSSAIHTYLWSICVRPSADTGYGLGLSPGYRSRSQCLPLIAPLGHPLLDAVETVSLLNWNVSSVVRFVIALHN